MYIKNIGEFNSGLGFSLAFSIVKFNREENMTCHICHVRPEKLTPRTYQTCHSGILALFLKKKI